MAGLRKAVAAAWSRRPDSMEPTVPPDLPAAVQVGPSALNFDVRPVHAPGANGAFAAFCRQGGQWGITGMAG